MGHGGVWQESKLKGIYIVPLNWQERRGGGGHMHMPGVYCIGRSRLGQIIVSYQGNRMLSRGTCTYKSVIAQLL